MDSIIQSSATFNKLSFSSETRDTRTNIVEMIGPPGIGKTTLYDALCKSWHHSDKWIYQEALLDTKPKTSEIYKWVAYWLRSILKLKKSKSVPVQYGIGFVDDHQNFANFCWDYLSNPNTYPEGDISKQFRSAYFLFSDFCRYQAIVEKKTNKPCLISEGLLQKSFFINDDINYAVEGLNEYMKLIPLPHAVIYINTPDSNLIIQRLKNRKKIIASQVGKDDQALLEDVENWKYIFEIVSDRMRRMNVPVYYLDGLKPVKENVMAIKDILS